MTALTIARHYLPIPSSLRSLRFKCKRFTLAIAFAVSLLLGGSPPASAADSAADVTVKAAFLYKFLAYIDWPDDQSSREPYIIGVLGADIILTELTEMVRGHSVNGRSVKVMKVASRTTLPKMHLLFVANSAEQHLARLLAEAPQRQLVVITETPQGFARGSVLSFTLNDGRVRFVASLPAAERVGVRLSSRLLAVAQAVRETP